MKLTEKQFDDLTKIEKDGLLGGNWSKNVERRFEIAKELGLKYLDPVTVDNIMTAGKNEEFEPASPEQIAQDKAQTEALFNMAFRH